MFATTEWSKYDPKDAFIASLAKRVHNLQGVITHDRNINTTKTTSTTSLSGQGISKDVTRYDGMVKWRIVKGEKNLNSDGNTYWWCLHQNQDFL